MRIRISKFFNLTHGLVDSSKYGLRFGLTLILSSLSSDLIFTVAMAQTQESCESLLIGPLPRPPFKNEVEYRNFFRQPLNFGVQDPNVEFGSIVPQYRSDWYPPDRRVEVVGPYPISDQSSAGGYYIFKNKHYLWSSSFRFNKHDIHGDPTNIFYLLPMRLAFHLGFRFLDRQQMIVPNFERLNLNITSLNTRLRDHGYEPIPYLYSGEIKITDEDRRLNRKYSERYVRQFIFEKKLPFEWREIVHDVSFHAYNMVLTERQWRPVVARLGDLVRFSDWVRLRLQDDSLRGRFPLIAQIGVLDLVLKEAFHLGSIDLDNVSGFIRNMLIEVRTGEFVRSGQILTGESPVRISIFHLGMPHWTNGRISTSIVPGAPYTTTQSLKYYLLEATRDLLSVQDSSSVAGPLYNLKRSGGALIAELEQLILEYRIHNPETVIVKYGPNHEVLDGIVATETPQMEADRRLTEILHALDH